MDHVRRAAEEFENSLRCLTPQDLCDVYTRFLESTTNNNDETDGILFPATLQNVTSPVLPRTYLCLAHFMHVANSFSVRMVMEREIVRRYLNNH
jgi:hypothetical protein